MLQPTVAAFIICSNDDYFSSTSLKETYSPSSLSNIFLFFVLGCEISESCHIVPLSSAGLSFLFLLFLGTRKIRAIELINETNNIGNIIITANIIKHINKIRLNIFSYSFICKQTKGMPCLPSRNKQDKNSYFIDGASESQTK